MILFIAGWISGAIAMIMLGKHYADKQKEGNNNEV